MKAARKKKHMGKLILIVEDDKTQREILREIFELEGFRVDEAEDGAKAIERIHKNPPDLIVLDAVLPQFDGLHVIASTPQPAPPIFVITGYDHIVSASCYEFGATIVFRKPLNVDEMVAAAKRHLGELPSDTPKEMPDLTDRERQVLTLIAAGNSTQDVAKMLDISVQTVFVFRKNIKRKFGGISFIQICARFRK